MTISCKENGDDVFADNYAAETAGTPAMAPVDHLYETHSFYRQTRQRGKILKTVTELYLREDLGFGCYYVENDDNALPEARKQHVDKILGKPQTIESTEHLLSLLQVPMGANPTTGTAAGNSTSTTTTTTLVVCDTNVLLHNLDVLEQSAAVMPNLVIPQTALMECRANQVVAYDRTVELLRSVGKSKSEIQKSNRNQSATDHSKQQQQQQRCCIFFPDPHHAVTASIGPMKEGSSVNDENDARIRNVALFFGENLRGTNVRVVFLTDDAESRRIASATAHGSFEARSAGEWVRELERQFPTVALRDLVAQFGSSAAAERDTDGRQQQGDDDGNKQKKERQQFAPHVDALALSNGITNGVYHRGVLRSRDSSSALVTIRRGEERVAVTINGSMDRNRAVDGDVVAIALHPLDQWIKSLSFPKQNNESSAVPAAGIANDTVDPTLNELSNVAESMMIDGANDLRPTGKVVGIMRRNFENHSGSIYETKIEVGEPWTRSERDKIACLHEREHADGSATCVFFPVDKKVPPILIRTIQRDRLLGQRIVVCMDSWPVDSSYPFGHYVRTIGLAGTKDVETEVLLQQFDIPHQPFPASVLACLPPENYRIDEENSSGREDIRHIPVLSIDPPNCKDIDDALHCIELRNGNYQVGVHIADVTHFVKAGTAIDLEAANRSTSTYLVNKRLDMLPGLLTTDLCSLKGNVDRYAFSVLWEVSPDAEIINVNFKKTIIHSIAALTYQQAQSFIEQPDAMDDIQAGAVKRLALLARKFRKRRIDAGALTLASPEVKCMFCYV